MTHKLTGVQQGILFERVRTGTSFRAVAKQFNIDDHTAKRVYEQIRQNNIVRRKKGSGRKPKWSQRDARLCKRLIYCGEAETAVQLKRILAREYNKTLSVSTIKRILKSQGLNGRIKVKKPKLTARHKKLRLAFAKKYKHWKEHDWRKVIFSDETKINRMGSDGKQYIWRRVNEPLSDRTVKPTLKGGGGSMMIWGCMGANGVGHATKVTGTVNSELYLEILKDEMLNSREWCLEEKEQENMVFQQDNASCHKSHLVMDWLKEQKIQLLDHPPQSPDLNPIENLWRILKLKIHENNDITSLNQLWEVFEKEWEDIDQDICQKLVESMPRRLAAVIAAKGGHTKY